MLAVLPDGIIGFIKWLIIIGACVGVLFVVLRVSGVAIPPWFVQILWICAVAFVAIVAISFLAAL